MPLRIWRKVFSPDVTLAVSCQTVGGKSSPKMMILAGRHGPVDGDLRAKGGKSSACRTPAVRYRHGSAQAFTLIKLYLLSLARRRLPPTSPTPFSDHFRI